MIRMKTKIRVLMLLLAVILLGVLILGFQGAMPIPMTVNVVAAGVFVGVLLVLIYMGQIEVVKKILLSLVIEAEQIYGSGTGKMKYNYVLGKAYSMIPGIVKLFVTEKMLSEILEAAVVQLQAFLSETRAE
jgi:ABC-type transport system involved in cytochrome c biogenesis permease component